MTHYSVTKLKNKMQTQEIIGGDILIAHWVSHLASAGKANRGIFDYSLLSFTRGSFGF